MRFTVKRVAPVRLLTPLFVCAAVAFAVVLGVVAWSRYQNDTIVRTSNDKPRAVEATAEPDVDAVLVVCGHPIGRHSSAISFSHSRVWVNVWGVRVASYTVGQFF
jgi:hypothetical protein